MNRIVACWLGLLLLYPGAAMAKIGSVNVTPEKAVDDHFAFEVSVEGDEILSFLVTVTAEGQEFKVTDLSALLWLGSDEAPQVRCPVAFRKRDNSYLYRFEVRRSALTDASFGVTASHSRKGPVMGVAYKLKLKDFVKPVAGEAASGGNP